jgi:hypothetical protein
MLYCEKQLQSPATGLQKTQGRMRPLNPADAETWPLFRSDGAHLHGLAALLDGPGLRRLDGLQAPLLPLHGPRPRRAVAVAVALVKHVVDLRLHHLDGTACVSGSPLLRCCSKGCPRTGVAPKAAHTWQRRLNGALIGLLVIGMLEAQRWAASCAHLRRAQVRVHVGVQLHVLHTCRGHVMQPLHCWIRRLVCARNIAMVHCEDDVLHCQEGLDTHERWRAPS